MQSYYLFSSGTLFRKDNSIRIQRDDGEYKDLKIEVTRDIYLFGEITLNSKCLNYLSQNRIPVHLFNFYGFYTGSFYPRETNVSGTLLVNQVMAFEDKYTRLRLAKKFVEGASYNILRNLKYYSRRGKDLEEQISRITMLEKDIAKSDTIKELMGLEGNIHREYYRAWQTIFDNKVNFSSRVRRPPDNMVNTLISFLNMMVYSTCLSEIYVTQLNPTVSYLHSPDERRFSLCLDISEVFKPLIVDRLIFSLINKKQVSEKDFEKGSNGCYMKKSALKKVTKAYDDYLNKTLRHRSLGRNVSYRHLIRLECYKVIKDLMDDVEYSPFKIWW